MSNEPADIRTLLNSVLDRQGGDCGWSLLAPRLHSLDALSPFEKTLLPLAYDRWRRSGGNVADMPVVHGLYRKTIVRNRLFLIECEKIIATLRAAGIDALVFKSGGLLGRLLPEQGVRAIADIDLWVRPSQIAKALKVLGSLAKGPSLSDHAVTISIPSGLQLDLHTLPSHIYADRFNTAAAGEALFDSAYGGHSDGHLSVSDLLYFSFLNPLFSHPPGESRSAFALLELDMALAADAVTDEVLHDVSRRVREDQTAAVFLEHCQWLGTGQSARIDRFIGMAVAPAAQPRDVELAQLLSRQTSGASDRNGNDAWLRTHARSDALASGRLPVGKASVFSGVARRFYGIVRRDPGMLLVWCTRRSSWQRLWRVGRHMTGKQPYTKSSCD
jgi:hypothetical protein